MSNQKLKPITSNIWVKEQPLKYLGIEVGTRMTIIRLADNQIALISPIQLDPQIITEINSLGTVKYIIAPNLFHYLYVQSCKDIYPNASLITAPGLETKKPNIKSDLILTQDKIDFNGELEYFLFAGYQIFLPSSVSFTVAYNEIVFYHPESKTLILTDTAFNLDNNFPFLTQFTARIIGCYEQLRPSILEKIAIQDKQQITASVKKLLQWDFQRVIMAHGTIVENNGKQQLKEGYEWFLNTSLDM
jgi:hypothetical protein